LTAIFRLSRNAVVGADAPVKRGAEKEHIYVLLVTSEVIGEESNVLGGAVLWYSLVEDLNYRLGSGNELGTLRGFGKQTYQTK
jgi:hypothetical protein